MKQIGNVCCSLLLVLALLLGVLPVTASSQSDHSADIVATNLMAPVNPNASQEAKNMLAFLYSLSEKQQLVVGQFDISTCDLEWNNIYRQFGQQPGLYSNRYVLQTTDSPQYKAMEFTNIPQANQLLQNHYEDGTLLLVHADGFEALDYLVNIGIASGAYYDAVGMVAELDDTNPDRNLEIYNGWMQYINNFLDGLRDLESRGVKAYMVRPFVESNTKGFFGTTAEHAEIFVRVYQQFITHFKESGLTGWLMTYSPACGWDDTFDRYPGNAWMDVIGVTMYSDSQYDGSVKFDPGIFWDYDWFELTGKPIGLTELSCRNGRVNESVPRASWLNTMLDIQTYWPRVTWVNCWSGGNFSLQNSNADGNLNSGTDDGKSFMNSPFSLTLEDLPNWKSGVWVMPGVVQLYRKENRTGDFVGLEERLYTAAELNQLGVTAEDVRSFHINDNFSITFYSEDEGEGDYWGYAQSTNNAVGFTDGTAFASLRVKRQENVALNKANIFASDNDEEAWKANDGYGSRWTCQQETGWLMIDLDSPCTISRYTVRHAGYGGESALYNTADFRLQYSVDGENWVTVDTVIGNTVGVTQREVTTFTAQYVRLMIDKANTAVGAEAARISIAELELYGMDTGLAFTAKPSKDESKPDKDVSDPKEDDFQPDEDTFEPEETAPPSDGESSQAKGNDSVGSTMKPVKIVTYKTYFPWWGWVLIAVGILLAGGAAALLVYKKKKKTA